MGTKVASTGPRLPARRPLKIYAFDPMLGGAARNRISVDVPNEPLRPGPAGTRIAVVDYDAANQMTYPPVDLDAPEILMSGGIDPTSSDPRFHQQMVYAVAMKVVENFEQALGRRWFFRGAEPLKMYPHAFMDRNAGYYPRLGAVLFGYFRADPDDPGPNLPGQTVFSCLSHDIIAHETTHAMVDRLRDRYFDTTNRDVLAFHEGFADIVAILQHFTFPSVLANYIAETRGDIRTASPLIELAAQFGYTTGRGGPLRSALDDGGVDPTLYATVVEPHERGRLLLSAVFDAFFTTYRARTRALTRIASGGSGVLPPGDLHPDLVHAFAEDAARTAQNVLRMCIRAFDYLPPVDPTFGDYLRAVVTADLELVPDDPLEQRNALIEGFRARGILPTGVSSLATDALVWPEVTLTEGLPPNDVRDELQAGAQAFDPDGPPPPAVLGWNAPAIHDFAVRRADELDLDPERTIAVRGFHPMFRLTRDGQLRVEVVIQLTQAADQDEFPDLGGLLLRGGTTLVARSNGQVRYVISKPLPYKTPRPGDRRHLEGLRRLARQQAHVRELDDHDATLSFIPERAFGQRQLRRSSIARLDGAPE